MVVVGGGGVVVRGEGCEMCSGEGRGERGGRCVVVRGEV